MARKASWGISTEPDGLHALLALLLLLEELALAGDVAAVALGGDVLAEGAMVSRAMILPPMAAWMATSYCCRWMTSLSFSARSRPRVWLLAVQDHAERVDGLAVDEHVDATRSPSR
jgi:hypothetical protein